MLVECGRKDRRLILIDRLIAAIRHVPNVYAIEKINARPIREE